MTIRSRWLTAFYLWVCAVFVALGLVMVVEGLDRGAAVLGLVVILVFGAAAVRAVQVPVRVYSSGVSVRRELSTRWLPWDEIVAIETSESPGVVPWTMLCFRTEGGELSTPLVASPPWRGDRALVIRAARQIQGIGDDIKGCSGQGDDDGSSV